MLKSKLHQLVRATIMIVTNHLYTV